MKLLIIALILNLFAASAFAEKFAVVVNKNNEDKVNVKKYFLLKSETWPKMGNVSSYEMSSTKPEYKAFIKNILKMDIGAYQAHWNDRKSSGKTKKPTTVKSASYMYRFIKNKKGAIGYLPEAKATGLKIVQTFEVP